MNAILKCYLEDIVCVLVAQLDLIPCDPMDCSPPGSSVPVISHQEYWSGWPFPSPGDLPNPGIEPRSPTLQTDSSPPEPQGKLRNTGVGSLSDLQQIFWPSNPTQISCIADRFFTIWATREDIKGRWINRHLCICSVAKLCPTLCNAMNCSTPGFPVLHCLLEFVQTHVHWVGDAI